MLIFGKRCWLALALVLSSVAVAVAQPPAAPRLVPHTIHLASGRTFSLNLPADFEINIAAQGLHRVRFLARAPDGRIFTTDMHDRSDNSEGVVYILDGFDAATGRFTRVIPYLRHLRNPNDVAFYTDHAGQSWLYLPLTDKLERFRYKAGDTAPSSAPEVLATYPDYGLNYKYGGWHLTRTVAVGSEQGRDVVYVSVGSSCNNCEEKEKIRATISVMDPDGKNARIIARGMRNAVGLRFVQGTLYATNMGADHLGDDAPDDPMFALAAQAQAQNYGWPYCYFQHGKVMEDPMFAGSAKRVDCGVVPAAFSVFAAHSAPLGLEYFDEQNPVLHGSFLVALHGASKVSIGTGYRVVRVMQDSAGKGSPPQDFITGFLKRGIVYGRPCGILRVGPDAFLLTDDEGGIVYYVHRKS
jgi:glucose/arabinose dehydrogenase